MTTPYYTRSLRRRFIAFVIDLVLVSLVSSVLLFPFARSLDSLVRLSAGVVHYTSCSPGTAYAPDGTQLIAEGWTTVAICNSLFDGVFPNRTANLVQVSTEGSTTYTKQVAFPLDSRNRMAIVYYLDWLSSVLLLFWFAAFESSRLAASPGKLLMGLSVAGPNRENVGLGRALLRNSLKLLPLLIYASIGVISMYYADWPLTLLENGNRIRFSDDMFETPVYAGLTLSVILALISLGLVLSIILPWSKAGRGLYDRIAGTQVVR